MSKITKYFLLHVLCGLLAVYIAGVADKKMNSSERTSAPITSIFVMGPAGLILSTFVLVIVVTEKIEFPQFHFIDYIYKKGRN